MRGYLAYALCLFVVFANPAYAQDATTDTPSYDEETPDRVITPKVRAIMNTPQPPVTTDGEIDAAGAPPAALPDTPENKMPEYDDLPQVELRILAKGRAESRTYVLNVGRTVAYANIRIRPRACRKSSPLDDPENASFLQIWEVKPDQTSAWIFSGWMFASSPSLSGMDHPVYDVTVLDCKDPEGKKSDATATTDEPAPAEAPASEGETNTEVKAEGESAAPSKP